MRQVAVDRGKDDALRITLERDAESITGRKGRGPRQPFHFLAEVGAAAPLLLSLDGDASAGCMAAAASPSGTAPASSPAEGTTSPTCRSASRRAT